MNETWQIVGSLIGTGVIGAVLQGWWKARKDNRADAVDSANAKGQINMLADYERSAKEARAETTAEREGRLKNLERALIAEANLIVAREDIKRLKEKLDDVDPDTDHGALIETNFGALPESKS